MRPFRQCVAACLGFAAALAGPAAADPPAAVRTVQSVTRVEPSAVPRADSAEALERLRERIEERLSAPRATAATARAASGAARPATPASGADQAAGGRRILQSK